MHAALVVHFCGNQAAILGEAIGWSVDPATAAEMLGAFLRERLLAHLMERLGSDRPDLRVALAASAKPDGIVDWYGPTLQRYLTGKL